MFIYFCFLFCFNFLTVHHKKFTLSAFHQEVAFNQYFLPLPGVYSFVCFFVYLSVCFWCLHYSRTNGQIFIKQLVDRTWSKEEVTIFCERLGPFQCILMILAFYLKFLQK